MKRTEVRQHIIETASELFYAQGYNSTGINEIIAVAGIAKATLYNHFESKEDICLSYLNYMHADFFVNLKAAVAKQKNERKKFVAIFDFLEEFYLSQDFNGCWCLNTISELSKEEEKVSALIREQKLQLVSFFEELSDKAYPGWSKKKRVELSRQVYMLYESGVAESHLHREVWPIKIARGLCKKLLV